MKQAGIYFFIASLMFVSCAGTQEPQRTLLYNDSSGMRIEALIPQGWREYTNIRAIQEGNLIFQDYRGLADTSTWIRLRIYDFSSTDPGSLTVNSLLDWQYELERQGDTTFSLISKRVEDSVGPKKLGYFDFSVSGVARNYYCRKVVIIGNSKAGVVDISSRKDEKTFLEFSNDFVKNLRF